MSVDSHIVPDVLSGLRPEVRRLAVTGFLTLFAAIAAHEMLETARDALFLDSISPERLPWVYLLIAVVSFTISRAERRFRVVRTDVALRIWMLTASGITAGFWFALDAMGDVGLYALYVWTGVLITLLLLQFWTLLSRLLTVSDAKRIYSFIGAGSALGAIAGSGVAVVLTRLFPPRHLLLVAAGLLFVSVIGPQLLASTRDDAEEGLRGTDPELEESLIDIVRDLLQRPYALRVAMLVVLATLTVTVADYVFKATAARTVSGGDLGTFFATVYFGLNALSLLVQVFAVQWLIRRLSITGTLAVLPGLLVVAGAGFVVGGGIIAAVAMKSVDGALRHSLNRTSTELLYVPMKRSVRARVKSFIDVLGQRGAQAAASLLILGALALGAPTVFLAVLVVIFGAVWVVAAGDLRKHYLDLFREALNDEVLDARIEFADLDVSSLETLIAALNDSDDARVLAALELLGEEDRAHLIPAMILYHPNSDVVLLALELFVESGIDDFLSVAERVMQHHSDPVVRAAILSARARLKRERETLERHRDDESDIVRITAHCHLIANGWAEPGEERKLLRSIIEEGTPAARAALARAIGAAGARGFEDELITMLEAPETEVRRAVIAAMVSVEDPAFLLPLRDQLGARGTRDDVREALVEFGRPALDMLRESFEDESLPSVVRWQLPHAVGDFGGEDAVEVLVHQFPREPDGKIRYRIVRELERIRREENLDVSGRILRLACDDMIRRAYQLLDWRLTLERGASTNPQVQTTTHSLLVRMLRDKEIHAIDILIRIVGLLHPGENFAPILRGLKSSREELQASSRELLEYCLESPEREALLGLVMDAPPAHRVEHAGPFYQPKHPGYEELLETLLHSESLTLRSLAVRHVGELGLGGFRGTLEEMQAEAPSELVDVISRVMRRFSPGDRSVARVKEA